MARTNRILSFMASLSDSKKGGSSALGFVFYPKKDFLRLRSRESPMIPESDSVPRALRRASVVGYYCLMEVTLKAGASSESKKAFNVSGATWKMLLGLI